MDNTQMNDDITKTYAQNFWDDSHIHSSKLTIGTYVVNEWIDRKKDLGETIIFGFTDYSILVNRKDKPPLFFDVDELDSLCQKLDQFIENETNFTPGDMFDILIAQKDTYV